MDFDKAQSAATARIYARTDIRAARVLALGKLFLGGGVDPTLLDSLDRQAMRARLLNRTDLESFLGTDADASKKLFEAMITPNALQPRRFLDLGVAAARAVGRITVKPPGGVGRYGTGSLVSSHHLLTNNHVLPSQSDAANAVIELGYYEPSDGSAAGPTQAFRIRPDDFFYTSEELDFTLVGVETENGQASTSSYGRLRLLDEGGTALIGDRVNIIQHSGGQPQTIAIRANTVVDIVDPFIHYITDTAPGSSGSPVFNDEWQLVGLHHAAVPGDASKGESGTVNEGIRTSAIVQQLAQVVG